jgi:hypothetical protein
MTLVWSSLAWRRRLFAVAVAGLSLVAVVLVSAEGVDAAKKKNGIIFKIKTSQGIKGRITYLKHYEGEGRNFAQLEVEVRQRCEGSGYPYTERVNVILQGHTKGNRFSPTFQPQQSGGDRFRQSARVRFKPRGRSGGLPKWRKATGTVRSSRSIDDPFVKVDCKSGPVSFKTLSSRREHFGPRPNIIVIV